MRVARIRGKCSVNGDAVEEVAPAVEDQKLEDAALTTRPIQNLYTRVWHSLRFDPTSLSRPPWRSQTPVNMFVITLMTYWPSPSRVGPTAAEAHDPTGQECMALEIHRGTIGRMTSLRYSCLLYVAIYVFLLLAYILNSKIRMTITRRTMQTTRIHMIP